MIVLPFAGFWVGYTYSSKNVEQNQMLIVTEQGMKDQLEVSEDFEVESPLQNEIPEGDMVLDELAGFEINKKYGNFTLISNEASNAVGYSFPVAHYFTFTGETEVRGKIILDSMFSPFIEIQNVSNTGLPSEINGFNVVPDFITYDSVIIDSKITEIQEIYKEAESDLKSTYFIDFTVTDFKIQIGAPKASSIYIKKIKGAPKVSTTTRQNQ